MVLSSRVVDIAFWSSLVLGIGTAAALIFNVSALYQGVHEARAETAAQKEQLVKAKAETGAAVKQVEAAKQQTAVETAHLAEIRSQAADVEGAIGSQSGVLKDLAAKIDQKNREVGSLDGTIAGRRSEIAGLDGEVATRNRTIAALDGDVGARNARVLQLNGQYAQLGERLREAEDRIREGSQIAQTNDRLRLQIADMQRQASGLDQQIGEKREILRRLEQDIANHPKPAVGDNFCSTLRSHRAGNPAFDPAAFCGLAPSDNNEPQRPPRKGGKPPGGG